MNQVNRHRVCLLVMNRQLYFYSYFTRKALKAFVVAISEEFLSQG